MKFKTDENVPGEIAAGLRAAGHDAMTVVEQALAGASDRQVAAVCQSEDRVLVTLDLDFADVRAHLPGSGPGVILLRPRTQGRNKLLALLPRIVMALANRPVSGGLWIVDEHRLRIRGR